MTKTSEPNSAGFTVKPNSPLIDVCFAGYFLQPKRNTLNHVQTETKEGLDVLA
ncbi:MAG: hypothetical protein ABJQ14_08720 [Hyphomicrobiales bacterium]